MQTRNGLTLIEIVLALLVFSAGGLGLAASAATIARQISASSMRSDAAFIARTRAEQARSSPCADLADGEARLKGIHSTWTTSGIDGSTLDQRLERHDPFGSHSDRFLSIVSCE